MVPDPLLYLLLHLSLLWVVRVLYHQPGPLAAMLDLALNLSALMAGFWAFTHSDSVFLGAWTFFLVQALYVGIPAFTGRRLQERGSGTDPTDEFQQAYRSAETALRKLSADQSR